MNVLSSEFNNIPKFLHFIILKRQYRRKQKAEENTKMKSYKNGKEGWIKVVLIVVFGLLIFFFNWKKFHCN